MKRYIAKIKENVESDFIKDFGGVVLDNLVSISGLVVFEMEEKSIDKFSKHKNVIFVEEDQEIDYQSFDGPIPIEYAQSESYYVRKLKLKDYWARGIFGDGVKVAVIDSGIFRHRDLVIAGGYNGYEENVPYDSAPFPHGTYVAGVIAAKHNDLGGFIGTAPNVELYAVKVDNNTGNGTLWNSAVVRGFGWCIENQIDIVNCSFSTSSNAVVAAAIECANAGAIVTCATGNAGNNNIAKPASSPECVAIGNVGYNGERYATSSYGEGIDLACYGHQIMTTSNSFSGYSRQTGTSIATPIVSGIFALYKKIFPNLTNAELKLKFYENCKNNDGSNYNLFTGLGIPQPPPELYDLPIITNFHKRIKVCVGQNKDLVAPKGIPQYHNGTQFVDSDFKALKGGNFV